MLTLMMLLNCLSEKFNRLSKQADNLKYYVVPKQGSEDSAHPLSANKKKKNLKREVSNETMGICHCKSPTQET